jgi:hypothetical protein
LRIAANDQARVADRQELVGIRTPDAVEDVGADPSVDGARASVRELEQGAAHSRDHRDAVGAHPDPGEVRIGARRYG